MVSNCMRMLSVKMCIIYYGKYFSSKHNKKNKTWSQTVKVTRSLISHLNKRAHHLLCKFYQQLNVTVVNRQTNNKNDTIASVVRVRTAGHFIQNSSAKPPHKPLQPTLPNIIALT